MSVEGWPIVKLGDIATVGGGKRLPKNTPYAGFSTGYPYIRLVDIEGGKISNKSIQYIDKQTHTLISRYVVATGDVCLAIVGNTIGMIFYVDKEWNGANLTENAAKLTDFDQADPKFVYFYLTSADGQNEIFKNEVGSAQGKLPIYGIQNIELTLPPLAIQTRIADILSALDDKIELTRQTNATLEAIAQAIFKEWFVDFHFPGATGEMQESEFGLIPNGWQVKQLGDVVGIKGGTTPSTKKPEYWNGEYCWSTPKDLSNLQSPILLDTARKISKQGVQKISSGVLPKGTLLLSSRAPIGYLAITQIPVSINQGYIAIQGRHVSNLFMLFWLKDNMVAVKERANGSTFQEISKSNFREINILLPLEKTLREFEKLINPIFENLVKNEFEIKSLSKIRDTLLPKLMSGEIEL